MPEGKAPDWLPAGWTVNRTVRKSGKKDVCYIDPLNELKFYSKPEVLRHLEKEQEISHQKSYEKKSTSKHVENVLVVKPVPEELPPGWTKEMKVKKKGGKIRKDSFYTDPVSGYIFRSLKDVNRYLRTGVVGKLAFKPKDDSRVDMELKDEKLTTDSAAEGDKSADEGTVGQITGYQSSKLVETGNDELTFKSTDPENAVCISENASEQSKENVAAGNVNIPEASGLNAREEKTENELKEKQAMQDKKKKSSEKSKPDLPRRASKRLAGVEVDLPREPKTRRQAGPGRETKVTTDKSSNEKEINSAVLLRAENLPNLGKRAVEVETNNRDGQDGNVETDNKPEERQDGNAEAAGTTALVLTPGNHSTSKEHDGNVGTEERNREVEINNMPMECQEPPYKMPPVNIMNNSNNVKLELPNDLPPTTAEDKVKKVELDNKDKACEKRELSNIFPPSDLLISGEHTENMVTGNKADIKPESPVNFSLTDLWSDPCIEFAVKTLTGSIPVGVEENRVESYSGSPLDLPLGGLWTDPCIDFAVKTLTGAIPVAEDLNVEEYFQQHACSSEKQDLNGPTLSDTGVPNFYQTDFVSQRFNNAENSVDKQQEFGLQNQRNGSLQFPSGGTDLNKRVNNGECSIQTFFK